VPRISTFYGIVIWMYDDKIQHLGRPHFHAGYGGDEASIDIEDLAVLAGRLPPRALRLVVEWAGAHQVELREIGLAHAGTSRSKVWIRCPDGLPSGSMRSTPLLVAASPLDGYVVRLRFEDGTAGDVDLGYLLEYGGIFEPLADPLYFREMVVDREAGTIVWPNDADIAPETLYARARSAAAATA
jgi:Protein of unknown function (DUF2442)/Domain of unknown function (DUF4160)